ncbi:MAG TPA: DUF6496 domain-containing protein [Verrucomicrobiae bacterium]|nr:DUF6496 domain-containing protein [Verrucomicrobiae bacterium]
MPEERATRRARKAKSPSSKAGEFVREEFEHIRHGKHGARSARQAVAIGLSKARKAGAKLPPPPGKPKTKATSHKPNPKRSRATRHALPREGSAAGSHRAISRQVSRSARERGPAARERAARKAVAAKRASGRRQAARKVARTRARDGN